MKIKIDENLPAELAADFRAAGVDAVTVGDEGLTGSADDIILDAVRREGRTIMTMDKGIADVRAYAPTEYAGIILIRSASAGRMATMSLVRRYLPALVGWWFLRNEACVSGRRGKSWTYPRSRSRSRSRSRPMA